MRIRFKVVNIDWCVEDEDIIYEVDDIEKEIQSIKDSLPAEVNGVVEMETFNMNEDECLDEFMEKIDDYLSNTYGWLVYDYEIEEYSKGGTN